MRRTHPKYVIKGFSGFIEKYKEYAWNENEVSKFTKEALKGNDKVEIIRW